MNDTRSPNAFALAIALFVTGLVGILSMLTMPALIDKPEALAVSDQLFKILLLVNPTILLALAVAIGTPAALAVGLRSPVFEALLSRGEASAALHPMLRSSALVAIAAAVVLLGYGAITTQLGLIPANDAEQAAPSLAVRLLYGGLTEEVMMRWGAMSLFAWLFTRVKMADGAFWLANLAAAFLFAAGHLPLLHSIVPEPSMTLTALVLVGNAVPGLLFGWLFWRKGLEAAMIAHAGAHLIAWAVSGLVA